MSCKVLDVTGTVLPLLSAPWTTLKEKRDDEMRKSLWIVLALLVVGGAPVAHADTFVYQVTSTINNVDVVFDLPTFEEVATATTFTTNSSSGGPFTAFCVSGNTTACHVSQGGFSAFCSGLCFAGVGSNFFLETGFSTSPAFTGPGTFTTIFPAFTTTVTITDVPSGVPEPSSLALIPLGLGALLLMRKRMGHNSPSAV